jgi:putative ABC transport system ATP-binding protein
VTDKPLIRVENLGKHYETAAPDTPPALSHVSVNIFGGEFVAIMGPSGSGKSTFMNLLGCLDVPTSGAYFLNDRNVAELSLNELADVRNSQLGFVFQGFNLLKRVSALDNVALPLLYAGVGRRKRHERAQELLTQIGLGKYGQSLPNRMSGGQQQRVAIARALANSPKVILADEPTGNLDSETSNEIMGVLARLNREQGLTIILVTHELDVANFANRLIRFKDGIVVHDGPVTHQ